MSQPQLFDALSTIAKEKAYAKITITDICQAAHISRMTFYRSYNSIDDIVAERLKTAFESYGSDLAPGAFDSQQVSLALFRSFRKHEALLSLLNKGNLSSLLEDELEQFLVSFSAARVQANCDEERNRIVFDQAYMAGGISRVLLRWAENGMNESDKTMAEIVGEHLPKSMNAISIKEQ